MKLESRLTLGNRSQFKLEAAAGAKSPDRPKIFLVSRLLLNEQLWCRGEVVVVEGGKPIQLTPRFQLRADPPSRQAGQ